MSSNVSIVKIFEVIMTSYKLKATKFLNNNKNNNDTILSNASSSSSSRTESLIKIRNSINNSSGSSNISVSSSSSVSSSINTNTDLLLNVKIIFPNGSETIKKIDSKKAIYDLLIELSASAKLIPTNFTLKLYNKNENTNEDKLVDYTPNQTIGQLNPTMIKLIPKTSTLKHQNVTSQQQQQQQQEINNNNYLSTNRNQTNLTTTLTATKHPFELTICVQVNLPFNQKTIVRVKPDIKLNDLFDLICAEAKLERIKYNFLILNKNNLNMDETFDSFNTKEVCLVLKNNNNNETASSKTLNSKSTYSIFTQNSTKSRVQSKNIYQNNLSATNKNKEILLLRSKSEIDLTTESETTPINTSSSTMLGLFKRNNKKLEKESSKHHREENVQTQSTNNNISQEVIIPTNIMTSKKKAPAPPPPAPPKLDDEIAKLLNSTKKKAPAPPPPKLPSFEPIDTTPTNNDNQLKIETNFQQNSPKSLHLSDYSSSSSSAHQNNLIKMTNSSTSNSISPQLADSYSVPSSPASSVSSSSNEKKQQTIHDSNHVVITHIHYIQKNQAYSSPVSSNHDIHKSSTQFNSSDNDDSIENSITSGGGNNEDQKQQQHHQNSQEIESIADNEYSTAESINNNVTLNSDNKFNNKNNSIHSSNTSIYKNDDESLLELNMHGKFYGKVCDQKTFSEDDFSDLESIKTTNSPSLPNTSSIKLSRYQQYLNKYEDFTLNQSIKSTEKRNDLNNNDLNEKKNDVVKIITKRTVQTEQRPEYSTSLLSYITKEDEQLNRPISLLKENIPLKLNKEEDIIKQQQAQFIRSPSSPMPQFPAIGENEMNEQHQNYTVVRSGDIIEKNGTYYSTDGTIRGYSGTVKKIANSKTLNEIFTKQQELEQKHERDYQLELELKQKQDDELQKRMNSLDRKQIFSGHIAHTKRQSLPQPPSPQLITSVPPYTAKGRSSINNIITNEKINSLKSNTLSHYSNVFKQQTSLNDNELSKKLEERANKLAQVIHNKQPLRIDTNLPTSNSNSTVSSLSSSNSYTTTNNNNNNNNNNTASSISTQASSSSSSSSPQLNRTGYTKIYDLKNETMKLTEQPHSTSSSSSSMSTFSYELMTSKPFQANPKPYSSVKTGSLNNNKKQQQPASIDYHTMLLNEIKKVVPLVQDINNNNKINDSSSLIKVADPVVVKTNQMQPPPPPANPPSVKSPPIVAPKNFSNDALKSINKKNQVINNRDNLLDSIKTFSVSSLRRVDLNK